MYRLKSKIITAFNLSKDILTKFIQDFPTKEEAKAAAEKVCGEKLKWKVKRGSDGKKKKITSGNVDGLIYIIRKINPKKLEDKVLKAGPGPGALDDPRTVREFVEDMISAGRTPGEVIAIARSCRWDHHLPAVRAVLEEFSKN